MSKPTNKALMATLGRCTAYISWGDVGERPFYWSISGLSEYRRSSPSCGYTRTLTAAKSMCSREMRFASGLQATPVWRPHLGDDDE